MKSIVKGRQEYIIKGRLEVQCDPLSPDFERELTSAFNRTTEHSFAAGFEAGRQSGARDSRLYLWIVGLACVFACELWATYIGYRLYH